MKRVDILTTDINDPILVELRLRVQNCKPYEPKPGDPDYLTPEQIARIKEEIEDES